MMIVEFFLVNFADDGIFILIGAAVVPFSGLFEVRLILKQ